MGHAPGINMGNSHSERSIWKGCNLFLAQNRPEMWGTIAEKTHGKEQPLSPWLAAKGVQSNSENARSASARSDK